MNGMLHERAREFQNDGNTGLPVFYDLYDVQITLYLMSNGSSIENLD